MLYYNELQHTVLLITVQYRALVMAWFRLFYPHMGIVTSLLKWSHLMSCELILPARTVNSAPLFTQTIPL
jgi:hypothetical protein